MEDSIKRPKPNRGRSSGVWMAIAGLVVCAGTCSSAWSSQLALKWRLAYAALSMVPVFAIMLGAARILFPQPTAERLNQLSFRQRRVIYWVHFVTIVGFFTCALGLLLSGSEAFRAGADHHFRTFMMWLWAGSILLVSCLADISGDRRNIWRPIRPSSCARD